MKTASDKLVRGWRRRSMDSVSIAEAESALCTFNSQNREIGLPALNGIEVAEQVRQLSPDSKIIFLMDNSPDVVKAA